MNQYTENCSVCDKEIPINEVFVFERKVYCRTHYTEAVNESLNKPVNFKVIPDFDIVQKPEHYHMYDMDTLTFLEQGFPPYVLRGFCTGSIIKYLQRYEFKNGMEDLKKAQFYMNKLVELEDKKSPQ